MALIATDRGLIGSITPPRVRVIIGGLVLVAALCAALAVWAATSEVSAAGITCDTALHEPDQDPRPALSTVCDSGRTMRQFTAAAGAAGGLPFGGAALATGIRRRGPRTQRWTATVAPRRLRGPMASGSAPHRTRRDQVRPDLRRDALRRAGAAAA
ncbi:hypothetical protein GCM10017786_22800 [Amycolatopsis deserti]|uniref:Uncharacterized protein n=1 Tax=Amycolatopsis deserti TaxID=185696 RepID=A0ABQ3IU96_9PSEU|nr:hypothetical protein GCM10017786_22800 [Amycolatopsis deserti]